MSGQFSRRDFLKLLAISSAGTAFAPLMRSIGGQLDPALPNVLIFVFDAWGAAHLKMYGYPRDTMPNLEAFAQRAFVYHNHYSTGSYTVPGTASILTGLYPWTHRALTLTSGGVVTEHKNHNIFAAFGGARATLGYAQNPYADNYLYQFQEYIDTHVNRDSFNLERSLVSGLPLFENDARLANISIEDNIVFNDRGGKSSSIYWATLWRLFNYARDTYFRKKYLRKYDNHLPASDGAEFLLDKVVNGVVTTLQRMKPSTLAYLHFFPPHAPYAPTRKFASYFDDGWVPPKKPLHPLAIPPTSEDVLRKNNLDYDRYLASWDAEFGRVFSYLKTSGLLDNSIVVFTSDHGDLFERGVLGHMSSVLARPVSWSPLLISLPGQTQRRDFHTFTSSVDLLPTLAHLTGIEIPSWSEGILLPGLGGEEDSNRSVYSIIARSASTFSAIKDLSISIMKQGHRLVYYHQKDFERYEFYDLDEDPDEMKNIYDPQNSLAKQMLQELLQKITEFNRPYLTPHPQK